MQTCYIPESFKEKFPEFADLSDEFIEIYLQDASIIIDKCKYKNNNDLYCIALGYLTAHIISLVQSGSASGLLSSIKLDSMSKSFHHSTTMTDSYAKTPYGELFQKTEEKVNAKAQAKRPVVPRIIMPHC